MLRRLAALTCAFAAPAASNPPLPAELAPYVAGGRFDPGDWGWARGAFADAPPAKRAAWNDIRAWLDRCAAAERERTARELATLGVADPKLDGVPLTGGAPCAEVGAATPPERLRAGAFPAFARALAEARPIVAALRWSVALARDANAHDELRSRVVADQMLRAALMLGDGRSAKPPALSADARDAARVLIASLTRETDEDNAVWLDRRLGGHGWPKVSEIGRLGANDAWLLAQHADARPALQLRALRAMEPLVAAKEADGKAYAYLHDRVSLKLSSKQRYGTQVECVAGARAPRAVEDPANLDRRRAEAGLQPIADYLTFMNDLVGPCPPDAVR